MRWAGIRQVYPNQWLIIEALEAHTMPDGRRQLDCLAMIETCPDGRVALQKYRHLHQQYPLREFYFVHTSRVELDIRERQWRRVRSSQRGHSEASHPTVPGSDALPSGRPSLRIAAPSSAAWRAGRNRRCTAGDGVRRAGVCMALGAAPDPSAIGVRSAIFFCVPPGA